MVPAALALPRASPQLERLCALSVDARSSIWSSSFVSVPTSALITEIYKVRWTARPGKLQLPPRLARWWQTPPEAPTFTQKQTSRSCLSMFEVSYRPDMAVHSRAVEGGRPYPGDLGANAVLPRLSPLCASGDKPQLNAPGDQTRSGRRTAPTICSCRGIPFFASA